MKITGFIRGGTTPVIILAHRKSRIQLIIDTGFDGELCLNEKILKAWRFKQKGIQTVELADGSLITTKIYVGEISWFGLKKRVLANETSSKDSLLGTGLLREVEVRLDISRDKLVLIHR